MTPKLIVEQKVTAFVNQYRIYSTTSDGAKGELVAFAQQKRIAFKEKVTFYADEQKTTEIFGFRAEKTLDVHGKYFVEDAKGAQIGAFQKSFKKSLLNSTWNILDGNGEPAITISENSKVLAIFRRLAGFVSDIAELIVMLFRYHFVFVDNKSGETVGLYRKTKLLYDHYELQMTDEAYKSQDWRMFASMAVALDALQSR
jgi:hypothetical protein